MTKITKILMLMTLIVMLPTAAFAVSGIEAPEIVASTAVAGVVLLGGAVLVIRGRRPK